MTRQLAIIGLVVGIASSGFRAQDLSVPNRPDSLKFTAIRDRSFMPNELDGDELFSRVISGRGQTVDCGVIHRGAAR
jgi:hypothetical protein